MRLVVLLAIIAYRFRHANGEVLLHLSLDLNVRKSRKRGFLTVGAWVGITRRGGIFVVGRQSTDIHTDRPTDRHQGNLRPPARQNGPNATSISYQYIRVLL